MKTYHRQRGVRRGARGRAGRGAECRDRHVEPGIAVPQHRHRGRQRRQRGRAEHHDPAGDQPEPVHPVRQSGGIEFGVANLQEVNYALDGEAWWNGAKNPDLRVVGILMPLVEAIFVRADSDIMSVADLEGKPMTDGYTAQNTILPQLSAVLRHRRHDPRRRGEGQRALGGRRRRRVHGRRHGRLHLRPRRRQGARGGRGGGRPAGARRRRRQRRGAGRGARALADGVLRRRCPRARCPACWRRRPTSPSRRWCSPTPSVSGRRGLRRWPRRSTRARRRWPATFPPFNAFDPADMQRRSGRRPSSIPAR